MTKFEGWSSALVSTHSFRCPSHWRTSTHQHQRLHQTDYDCGLQVFANRQATRALPARSRRACCTRARRCATWSRFAVPGSSTPSPGARRAARACAVLPASARQWSENKTTLWDAIALWWLIAMMNDDDSTFDYCTLLTRANYS